MTLRSKFQNWFLPQTREAKNTPPLPEPDGVPMEVAPVESGEDKTSSVPVAVEADFVPPPLEELSPYEDARMQFNAATSLEARSTVLTMHPFFRDLGKFPEHDPALFLDVLDHMTAAMKSKGRDFFGAGIDDSNFRGHLYRMVRESHSCTCLVLQLGSGEAFLKWQDRAADLVLKNPELTGKINHALSMHLAVSSSVGVPRAMWLDSVERMGSFQTNITHEMVLENFYRAFT